MKRLIDSSALLEWMLGNVAFFVEEPSKVVDFIEFAIKVQPTVICVRDDLKNIPELQHGQWIFGSSKTSSWMKCSICCKSQNGQTATFSYCPNCGAKMDGGVDNV